jgi:hypothetical protein
MVEHQNIIDILRREYDYHMDQAKKIKVMLEIAGQKKYLLPQSAPVPAAQKQKVQWKAEILNLFKAHGEINTSELPIKLSEKGIYQAGTEKGLGLIYSTLSRMAKDGILEKIDRGTYRIREISPPELKGF